MATFETSFIIPRPLAATFAFVTDFRNAPRWDPRAYEAKQLTPGPIGLGTRFLLVGGLIARPTLDRFHVPDWLRQTSDLEYEVVSFVPQRELVVRGETAMLRYEDHLVFSAEGDGTRLRYSAEMELKSVLQIGDPILAPLFHAIGEDATRGIPAAVCAAVPASAAPIAGGAAGLPLPPSPIVGPDDVRRVVELHDHRVLRNLLITQGYHDVSRQILARTGGADMNWCTLGSWASKTAGTFIRDEEVPSMFRKLLEAAGPLRLAIGEIEQRLSQLVGTNAQPPHLIDIINAILHDCSTYIMVGNKVVYAELAQCCADFVHVLGADKVFDPARLATFQATFAEGDPQPDAVEWGPDRTLISHPRGGQSMLRGMVAALYRAMFETDPKRRAEQILLANARGGLHEQTRLQTYIVGGLNAPLENTLVAWAHRYIDRDTPVVGRTVLHTVVDEGMPAIGRAIERAWQQFSTDMLMTLTLPDCVLHLGHPIAQAGDDPLFPPALQIIEDPELAALLDRYGALHVKIERRPLARIKDRVQQLLEAIGMRGDDLADVGAANWTDLDQRMRYILTLFRIRQQDTSLFAQPFTDEQRAAMFGGRVPPGPL